MSDSVLCLVCFSVSIYPESGSFNVDNVRVCKILVSGCFCLILLFVCLFFFKFEVVFLQVFESVLCLGLWSDSIHCAAWDGF